MSETYAAMVVTAPGQLALRQRPVPQPDPKEVLIAVEACGICGADRSDVMGADPASERVPGHEVVGRIVALGAQVPDIWRLGQRVGVGRLGGHCETCSACRRGQFHLCRAQPVMGATRDGGYAERMTARATGLVAIPDALSSAEAAPILCAGIATFNGLRASGAAPGDTVAVLGIGGLGHMAVQYARRMGFRTVAIGRGAQMAAAARALGAHHVIDTETEEAAARLTDLGGAAALLSTIGDMEVLGRILPGLAVGGRLVMLGIGKDPLSVQSGFLVGGERSITGSITGSPHENERVLDFSVLTDARPQVETLPLHRAQDAFLRMCSGEVCFRMVLTMDKPDEAEQ